MSAEITTFVCVPMGGARLLRTACASRYVAATREARVGEASLRFPTCRGCAIGKAHKGGEGPQSWPDGTPIVEIRLRVEAAAVPVTRAVKPRRVEKRPITFAPRSRKASPPETPKEEPEPFVYLRRRRVLPLPDTTPVPTPVVVVSPPVSDPSDQTGLATAPVVRDDPRMGKAPRWIEVEGTRDTIAGWSRRLGVSHTVIVERMRRGWPVELAVTLPKGSVPNRVVPTHTAPTPLAPGVIEIVLVTLRGMGLQVERVGSSSLGDMFVVRQNGASHEQ